MFLDSIDNSPTRGRAALIFCYRIALSFLNFTYLLTYLTNDCSLFEAVLGIEPMVNRLVMPHPPFALYLEVGSH